MPNLSSALSSWLVLGHSYYILSKRVDLLITLNLHSHPSRKTIHFLSPSLVSSRPTLNMFSRILVETMRRLDVVVRTTSIPSIEKKMYGGLRLYRSGTSASIPGKSGSARSYFAEKDMRRSKMHLGDTSVSTCRKIKQTSLGRVNAQGTCGVAPTGTGRGSTTRIGP